MLRLKHGLAAIALALASTPAMAASFITDPITDPASQWGGIDYWGVQVTQFSSLDQLLTFTIPDDSRVDIFMQGSPKFDFSALLLNGQSIASDFTVNGTPSLVATGYAVSGPVSLQFQGDYSCKDCWGDWFGGYVQVTKTASPASVAAVPEPATWAMMITGFAFVGAAMRRRYRAVRTA